MSNRIIRTKIQTELPARLMKLPAYSIRWSSEISPVQGRRGGWIAWVLAAGALTLTGCAVKNAPPAAEAIPFEETALPQDQDYLVLPSTAPSENVALAVDGLTVGVQEFKGWWQAYSSGREIPPDDLESEKRRFFQSVLNDMILAKAARDAGADKEPDFQASLRPAYRSLLADFFKSRYVLANIAVSPAEVEEYYRAHLADFETPPTISVRFILTPTRDQAMNALEDIQSGKAFDVVARTVSTHPSALNGGVLSPFSQGSYDADFERVAWSLKVGEMSGVVFTDLGYCVIEKTGQTDAILTPLDEVHEEIEGLVLKEKKEKQLAEFLNIKRQAYNVYINPAALDALTTGAPAVQP